MKLSVFKFLQRRFSSQIETESREKLFIRAEEEMLLSAAGHSVLWIPVPLEDQPGFRCAPTPTS